MEDKELIEECLRGNMNAFSLIVKKYQSTLLSISWNILREMEEAKDSVQEAFLQAFQNLEKFDQKRNFKNWLFSIAYKRAVDRRRRINFFFKRIREIKRNEERAFEQNREEIWEMLEKLNSKEKTAILLQALEGFTAKEIGDIIGCSENTVRVHIFNARRKLKKLLKEG
jgi:RNA polymerase sigma-70 factor (ECF subfamily)